MANVTFSAQTTYATGNDPRSVSVGDFNGDAKTDLVVANGGDNTVSVLLGNGNGTFQTQTTYATGSAPLSVSVGDFNGDGKTDLVVTNTNSNTVSVLLNTSNSSPTITSTATATTPENVFTSTAVYTAIATDPDAGTTLTYSISGGVDASLFNINSTTGAVTFKASPNFEAPTDTGSNNVYDIVVQANDGSLTGTKAVAILVNNVQEHFEFISSELAYFGNAAGGWSSDTIYPRELADVNGDGMADIVGFASSGVQISLA